MHDQWFGLADDADDSFDVGAMSPAEELFLATLRRYHTGWANWYGWDFTTFVVRTDDGFEGSYPEPIIAVVDLPTRACGIYGASFKGTRLRCDYVHSQLFYIDKPTSPLYLEADGDPEPMGAMAARWFLTQIRRHGYGDH